MKRGVLGLGKLLHLSVKFGGGGLVKPAFFVKTKYFKRFKHAQGSKGIGVGRILRRLKRNRHMGLGSKVIYLVRLNALHQLNQIGRIGHVPVMEYKPPVFQVLVLVKMINSLGIERGRTPFYAMHLIPFANQKFSKVSPILSGNTGN
jgi:hypothetical protein